MTEGTETEPRYFNYLKQAIRGVRLEVAAIGKTPERVVAEAIRLRNDDRTVARREGDRDNVYDQVWIVVDRDDHAYLEDAFRTARQEGILVAFSNPCFEVWPILHLSDHRAAITSAQHAKRRWSELRGTVSPNRECELLRGNLDTAFARAASLTSEELPGSSMGVSNPGTTVGDLVAAILTAAGTTPADAGL